MKTTIDRREFADAVAFVARCSPKRPPNPVLAGVMLNASSDGLTLTVFDYDVAAETRVDANVTSEGVALVHAASLSQIAAKLPQKPVTLTSDGPMLKITCGTMRASLPLMPAEQYPVPSFDGDTIATISGAIFDDIVQRVAIAASATPEPAHLLGVHLLIDEMTAAFAATDRYRVAHLTTPRGEGAEADVVVPASVMRDAAKAMGGGDIVEIGLTETGGVTFAGDRGKMLTRVLTGNYPPVVRLFPNEPEAVATIEGEIASEATIRAALAIDADGSVQFTFAGDVCSVNGLSGADGKGISESFEISYTGDERVLYLKPQLVIDALRACRAEVVQVWFTPDSSPSRPGAVMFTAGDGYRYLLQPIAPVK